MSILNFLLALLLLYVLWTMTVRWGLKKLSCSRRFSCDAVFEGETGEIIEVVRNDRPFLIPWLRVESRISPYLRLGRQDNLQVSGEMYYCSFFTMMPYQQILRRHRVAFLRRGAYDLGNAALTTGDIFGLCRFSRNQDLSAPVLVYPRILEPEDLPLPVSLVLGELVRRHQLLSDPFLVRGIRAYQPGDPVRDIHWPATARTGETQVRVHDQSARAKLLVVLNVQPQDLQWTPYISENHGEVLEKGIRLAASMCLFALRSGLSAGFASNMPQGDTEGSIVLLPEPGAAREEILLSAFARAKLRCEERFPALLERLTDWKGMDIVILSAYDSDSIREGMEKLRQAGNQVHFHLLEGGTL